MIRRLLFCLLVVMFCCISYAPRVWAFDQNDINAIIGQYPWYDPTDTGGCGIGQSTSDTTTTGSLNGSAYMLGDSITVRASDAINSAFQKLGSSISIDGSSSRSLNGPGIDGNKLTGMQAIQHDKDQIAKASVVIIALGTNGGDTNDSIKAAVQAVHSENSNASIYWADTITVNRPNDYNITTIGPNNRAIYDMSGKLGYQIIPWFNTVDPSGDPKHPTLKESDPNGYILPITQDSIGAHPTTAGQQAFAKVITSTVGGQPGGSSGGGNGGAGSGNGGGASSGQTGSIQDKIAQTLIVGFDASTPQSVIEDIATKYKIGGLVITGSSDVNGAGFTSNFFDKLGKDAGTPLMVASDEEGGQVQRFKYPDLSGGFPSAKDMDKQSDSSVQQIGKTVGSDLKNYGVTTDLAPVLDLDDGKNIISQHDRSFSSDPGTVASKAGAFAQGLEAGGTTPTYKHFPGFGGAGPGNTDTDPVTVPSSYDLNTNVQPYRKVLNQDNNANVMLSNLYIPSLTKDQPASLSPDAVNYLRHNLNFGGLIMTDDLGAFSQQGYKQTGKDVSLPDAVTKALLAGVDAPLFSIGTTKQNDAESTMDSIISAVKSNVPAGVIDKADAAMAQAKNISYSSTTSDTGGQSCCGGGGGGIVSLNGKDNEEKAFNFFLSKGEGAIGSAGIVGNFIPESSIQPERLQNTASGVLTPANTLSPAQINDSNLGWGVAQFTPPSKILDYAHQHSENPNDLGVQLDFIWSQIQGSIAQQIKNDPTPQQAANDFENLYERPYNITDRGSYGESVYQRFVKGAPTPPGAQSGGSGSNDTSSACSGPVASSAGYQNPLRDVKGLVPERIDEGVDYSGTGPVYAMGDGVVTTSMPGSSSWPGGNFVAYKLTSGDAKGHYVYFAEDCAPKVKVGDQVTSNTVICDMVTGSSGIETGWSAEQPNNDTPMAYSVYHEGDVTAFGVNFSQFLKQTGAPPGTSNTSNPVGSLPSNWPTW